MAESWVHLDRLDIEYERKKSQGQLLGFGLMHLKTWS